MSFENQYEPKPGGRQGGGALQGKGVGMYVVGHLKQTVAEQ